MGCHFFLQGILQTQGSNPGLLYCTQILFVFCTQILYRLSHKGSEETQHTPKCRASGPSGLQISAVPMVLSFSPASLLLDCRSLTPLLYFELCCLALSVPGRPRAPPLKPDLLPSAAFPLSFYQLQEISSQGFASVL